MLFIKRVRAGRAAICSKNTVPALQAAVVSLYEAFMHENHLKECDIISIQFSVTGDLNAANPATLLRSVGYAGSTALFCSAEPDIADSPQGVIRMLFYYYGRKKPIPVYRGGAERLRPDICGDRISSKNN
ncbi:MAG: chorismate mutase [Treponema sp.]